MIVKIGGDAAQQQIGMPNDIDFAVTLSLSYLKSPLALGDSLSAGNVLTTLRNITSAPGNP